MNENTYRRVLEYAVAVMLIVGILTAAFNFTLAGFSPVTWFVIAICGILLVICREVTQIKELLAKK